MTAAPTTYPDSDAELIARVRGGDVEAYGVLFERHRGAANRLARQLTNRSESDDLVAEAFAKVLSVLRGGGGPDLAFRAYLLTAVRRLHVDRLRSTGRLLTTGDLEPFDPGVPFTDTAVAGFERNAAAEAFASLPERWQTVLWHCEVEGSRPAEVAPLLGMSPNSVAALAYRAREGLRQAYLRNHLPDVADTSCRWTTERLGGFVRDGLSRRDHAKVEQHIEECRRCATLYVELVEVNSNLRGVLGPWLLGAASAGYLASTGKVAALTAGAPWWTRVVHAAHAGGPTGAVAAAGVTVSAVVGAAVFVTGGSPPGNPMTGGPSARPLVSAEQPGSTLQPLTSSSPQGSDRGGTVATPGSEVGQPVAIVQSGDAPGGLPGDDLGGTDLGGTDAGGTDPGGTDPGGTDPGGWIPGGSVPGDPDPGDPDPGDPDPGDPDPDDPDPGDPDLAVATAYCTQAMTDAGLTADQIAEYLTPCTDAYLDGGAAAADAVIADIIATLTAEATAYCTQAMTDAGLTADQIAEYLDECTEAYLDGGAAAADAVIADILATLGEAVPGLP